MNMLIRFFILMRLLKREQKNQSQSHNHNHNHNQSSLTSDTLSTFDNSEQLDQLFTPFERSYRILPHDMGFRNHLPNYRYLSFIELNITGWLIRCCQRQGIANLRWIISMQEVVYLKEVRFLDKMSVVSKLEGWDEKYIYFQHHFMVKNTLMAIGMTKFLLLDKQGKQSPQVLGMMGSHDSDVITSWNQHQTAIKSQ